MQLVRPNPIITKLLYSSLEWRIAKTATKKTVYLTFDDGPIPEITAFVLAELEKINAKATFFCIGKNISENPALFEQIIQQGHQVGNHTYNHLKGWRTNSKMYIDNIKQCASEIGKFDGLKNSCKPLFRPPYGKITRKQIKLIKADYRIIMWDVLSYDWDKNTSAEKCYKNVIQNVRDGSIIVFHDSVKASANLKIVLPKALKAISEMGFEFGLL
jgi:peptidoglycan/xylan/chitin deacetylase (PgdA/CDA1 family)